MDAMTSTSTFEDSRPTTIWMGGAALLLLVTIGGAVLYFRTPTPVAQAAVPTVSVAVPLVREISEWDSYIGRFQPSKMVEVRPRVSGEVTALHFKDGAIVRRGQLLFSIDRRPFIAELAEAQAGLESARSDLALAQAELSRGGRLIDEDAISKSEIDRLRARVRASNAAVGAAKAKVDSRELDLSFTQVRAPISGRISDRRVDPGNLVAAGEGTAGTLLTTINAVDPIYFTFDTSEALFLKARRAQGVAGDVAPVEIKLQDEGEYRWKGRLDFTDNGLSAESGTIRARALVSNSDLFLTPGMFGNMRLGSSKKSPALLVPSSAIQTDQERKMILTVAGDGTVTAKTVRLGPELQGLRVIRSGLFRTDRVIVAGAQMVGPGAKVTTKPGKIASTPDIVRPIAQSASSAATFAR